MKKVKKIALIGIPVLIVLISILYFFASPAYKTTYSLKNNNCESAVTYYTKVDGGIQNKLFAALLPKTLEYINNKYNADDLSLEETEKIYHTIDMFKSNIDISNQQKVFETLKNSKNAYQIATNAMQNREYVVAIENYEKVEQNDNLYESAQLELSNAKSQYKDSIEDKFYDCILKNDINGATEVIDKALSVISDTELEKKKDNLISGLYSDALAFLETSNEWETIEQAHAGPNEYCCYRITLAEDRNNVFRCSYVGIAANSLVQSGHVNSISGPVAWYRITYDGVSKVSYNEEKILKNGNSISWDYTMSSKEKLKKLELLFSE